MTYVLDTNTVSYFLRGEGNVDRCFQQEVVHAGNPYAIPYVVAYEIWRWLHDKPTGQIKAFTQQFDILYTNVQAKAEMSASVWKKAADVYIALKQRGQLIGDADILIAAYCIVNNYTLVTNNSSDFNRISGLNHVNWYT